MKITLLGTGTPAPNPRRAGSSFLVQFGSDYFIFDAGPGAYSRFLSLDISPAKIQRVAISHWHYDHFLDLPHFVLAHWEQGGGLGSALTIYGPPPVEQILAALFASGGVFECDQTARTQHPMSLAPWEARGGSGARRRAAPSAVEMSDDACVKENAWSLTALEVPHSKPYLTCLAYRLETSEGVLVYSGDSGPCDAMVGFSADADVLVHMCAIMSGSAYDTAGHREAMEANCASHMYVASLARDANVRTLVLTHITPLLGLPGVRERLSHEISQVFHGALIFGDDLLEVPPISDDTRPWAGEAFQRPIQPSA